MSGFKVEDEVSRDARHADLIAFLDTNDIRKGVLVSESVALEARRRARELSSLMKKTKKAGGRVAAADKGFLDELLECLETYKKPSYAVSDVARILGYSLKRALKVAHLPSSGESFVVRPKAKNYDDCVDDQDFSAQGARLGLPTFNHPLPEPDSPESSPYEDSDREMFREKSREWDAVRAAALKKKADRASQREKKKAELLLAGAPVPSSYSDNDSDTASFITDTSDDSAAGASAAGGGSGSAAPAE
jgi:hypothetical protein